MSRTISAFAPATVGNAAVGFDLLGFALEGYGDRVILREREDEEVTIEAITGVVQELPRDPASNTATAALLAMKRDLGWSQGFDVTVDKGITLGSGMGGSAASAVAAVVAASGFLDEQPSRERQLRWALAGEAVASGAPHADNAAPCLAGGLTAALPRGDGSFDLLEVPIPQDLRAVLVKPNQSLSTRMARQVLSPPYGLGEVVHQMGHLAGVLIACQRGDLELLGRHLRDVLVEPRRARLIPGFETVQRGAMEAGALGCSIAGAGPSMFAWCRSEHEAPIEDAMRAGFAEAQVEVELSVRGAIRRVGAVIEASQGA